MKTPDPEIFIRAAEMIDSDREIFACLAIRHEEKAYGMAREPHLELFNELYLPASTPAGAYFPTRSGTYRECRSHRVFALLLAAEIAKDGGL